MATINRRIYFYRLHPFVLNGAACLEPGGDLLSAFQFVATLPANYSEEPNRYLRLRDGNEIVISIDVDEPDKVCGKFATKRRRRLPPREQRGNYRTLRLGQDEGLAEIRHFLYVPSTGMLAIEFNFYAPRITRLGEYLVAKSSPIVEQVRPELMLSNTALGEVQAFSRYSKARIGVRSDSVPVVDKVSTSLRKVFQSIRREQTGAQQLVIELQLGTRKRDRSLEIDWLDGLGTVLSNEDDRAGFTVLEITGRDEELGKTRTVDVLEDALIEWADVEVTNEVSLRVESNSMYAALEQAHGKRFA